MPVRKNRVLNRLSEWAGGSEEKTGLTEEREAIRNVVCPGGGRVEDLKEVGSGGVERDSGGRRGTAGKSKGVEKSKVNGGLTNRNDLV